MSNTVLITGGAVRIGRSIALALAQDGFDIVIHYRNSHAEAQALKQEIAALGRKAHTVQADLVDEKAVAGIIPTLAAKGVNIDCLINNASLFEKNTLAELSRDNWQHHMDVNCFAPLQLIRDMAAHYTGNAGNVINITDGLSGWSMSPVFLCYTMSKLALTNATELLTRTLAPRIRINAIAPGATLESIHDKPETFEKLRGIIPMRRTGTPEEIVSAVRFILAAPSLSGQTIELSGGLHTFPQCSI